METRNTATREEEALRELGETEVSRRASILVSVGFCSLLAVPLVLQPLKGKLPELWFAAPAAAATRDDTPPEKPAPSARIRKQIAGRHFAAAVAEAWGAVNDERMRMIERRIIAKTVFPSLVQPATEHVLRSLGRGTDSVFIGRNDSFVFAEDVTPLWRTDAEGGRGGERTHGVGAAVRVTIDFAKQLRDRGIPLVVVPIPPGVSFSPDRITSEPVSVPVIAQSYRDYLDGLNRAGVEVIDLAAVFASHRSAEPLYLRRNTHWTGLGPRLAAEAVAEQARGFFWHSSENRAVGACTVTPVSQEVPSDLLALMRVPTSEANRPETTTVYATLRDGREVLPSKAGEVLVLGDSYVAIYGISGVGAVGGLVEQLSCALGTSVDRIYVNGGSATVDRQVLASEPGRLAGKTLVVWEFAARDLTYGEWLPVTL